MAGAEEKTVKKNFEKPEIKDSVSHELKEEIISKIQSLLFKEDKNIPEDIKEKVIKEITDKLPEIISRRMERVKEEIIRESITLAATSRKELLTLYKKEEKKKEEMFLRFNIHFRIQHMILFSSVILLILSGLPLKFPDFSPVAFLVNVFGGIESTRIVHRIAASLLVLFMVYHTLYTILHPEGRRDFLLLLPRLQDVKDVIQNLKYFFGMTDEKPKFGRFSYVEKFDYWAVYWGCVIMIGSGALMWFQELSLKILPKFVLDAAKEAHSDEALLATLAIVIWHFYNVHFNPDKFPGSLTWLHGKITKEEMMEHHPLEYEEIMRKREEMAEKNLQKTQKNNE
jgi:cytochrome b subunit of formate dehydrogenase